MVTPCWGDRVTNTIRLLVVDDHPVVRDGLTGMFAADPEFEVLGEAGDGAEAVRLAMAPRPDVILMDLRMPGTDALAAITDGWPTAPFPPGAGVLTTHDTDSNVLSCCARSARRRRARRCSPAVATRLLTRVRTPTAGPAQPARDRGARTHGGRHHQP
jgi:DNA-binding NarL/FixJ family response regulator